MIMQKCRPWQFVPTVVRGTFTIWYAMNVATTEENSLLKKGLQHKFSNKKFNTKKIPRNVCFRGTFFSYHINSKSG